MSTKPNNLTHVLIGLLLRKFGYYTDTMKRVIWLQNNRTNPKTIIDIETGRESVVVNDYYLATEYTPKN